MSRILRFEMGRRDAPRHIDAAQMWDYVRPRLGFPLPELISAEIETIVTRIWEQSEREMSFPECVDALDALARRSIMIPAERRELIVALIFDYLARNGYIDEGD